MQSPNLRMIYGFLLSALLIETAGPAASQTKAGQQATSKQFGYAVKKPIFGGADTTGPWGVLGTFVKQAMKNSGWDVQLCRTCAGGPREARLVSAAAVPPKPPAGRPDPGTPDGPLDFGATGAQFLWWAYQGTHDFKQDPGVARKNLRMIANIQNPSYMLFGVKATSGIADLRQIKEKRMPVRLLATPQGGDTVAGILAYYGLTKDALQSWGGKLLGNSPEERKDVDVMIGFGAMVRPEYDPWIDVSQRLDIKFLEPPEDLKTKLVNEYDLQELTIPEGLLRGVDRDMRGVGRTGDVVYGRDDMPNDFAYALAKNIDEHKDLLQWLIVPFSYNSQNVWKTFGVPLHAGAARYYREKGYMK